MSSIVKRISRTITTSAIDGTSTSATGTVQQHVRLNKLIADYGLGSRRDADEYIRNGWILVNGKVITEMGVQIPLDTKPIITLTKEGQQQMKQKQSNSFILNKPLGIVSCQPYDGTKHHSISAVQLLTAANYYNSNNTTDDTQQYWNNDNDNNNTWNSKTKRRQQQQQHQHLQQHSSSTTDDNSKKRLVFEPCKLSKLATAGRLDINSTGLLLFSQCGIIARTIIGPDSTIEKEYLVRINQNKNNNNNNVNITNNSLTSFETTTTTTTSPNSNSELPIHVYQSGVRVFRRKGNEKLLYLKLNAHDMHVQEILEKLRAGIVDLTTGEVLNAKSVTIQNDDQFNFVLTSGKYHHIRRMLDAVNLQAFAIKRIRIGSIRLGSLQSGQWRHLYPYEQKSMF
jgi:23S rRNA pseudouridine2604 synthase